MFENNDLDIHELMDEFDALEYNPEDAGILEEEIASQLENF